MMKNLKNRFAKTLVGQAFAGGGQPLEENRNAFTRFVKPFRSDSSQAKLTQLPAQSSQTKFCSCAAHSYGFTLAETMIVLIVLGVIASITIPPLVRRQIEAANRSKIKKSMTVYDFVMNKMTTENNLKSDAEVISFAGDENNNCAGSTQYFKKAEGSGCRFKTSDGVWWDISDILNPTISLNQDDLNNPNSQNTFKLLGHFGKAGELRVDDLTYEQTNKNLSEDQLVELNKLWKFVKNEKKNIEDIMESYKKTNHSVSDIVYLIKSFENNDNYKITYYVDCDNLNKLKSYGDVSYSIKDIFDQPAYASPRWACGVEIEDLSSSKKYDIACSGNDEHYSYCKVKDNIDFKNEIWNIFAEEPGTLRY